MNLTFLQAYEFHLSVYLLRSDTNTNALTSSCFHVLLEYLLPDAIGKDTLWFMGTDSYK